LKKDKILYKSDEIIHGYFQRGRLWVSLRGELRIVKGKPVPVELTVEKDYVDFVLDSVIPEMKTFKGASITEVYAKLSKWMLGYGITFKK
jgi:hypothetical protein